MSSANPDYAEANPKTNEDNIEADNVVHRNEFDFHEEKSNSQSHVDDFRNNDEREQTATSVQKVCAAVQVREDFSEPDNVMAGNTPASSQIGGHDSGGLPKPFDDTLDSVCYSIRSPNSPTIDCETSATRMSRALFLNAAIISDASSLEILKPPFVIFGRVAESEMPSPISFDREYQESDISLLIANRAVNYQRLSVKKKQVLNVDVTKKSLTWNSEDQPYMSKVYHMTDLCEEREMEIVGKGYQEWKQVHGPFVAHFPHLKCISSVGFIFSEKYTSEGCQMENGRLGSANILFYGKVEWDILDPSENERFMRENTKNGSGEQEQCKYSVLHKCCFIGSAIKSRFRFVTFTQRESQVVILPPGIIYQARSAKNCISAKYNFIDDSWLSLPNDIILDSCFCTYGEQFLSVDAIGILRDDCSARLLAKFYGTTEGWELEKRYNAAATASHLDEIGRQQRIKKSSDESTEESSDNKLNNQLVLFNGGIQRPLINSTELYGNRTEFTMFNSMQYPNGPSIVEKPNGSHNVQQLFYCPNCEFSFGNEKACLDHIASHNAKHICEKCTRAFKTKSVLIRHKLKCIQPGPPFTCTLCGLTYEHMKNLENHMTIPGKCEKNPIVCGCGEEFNRQGFHNHRTRSNPKCKFARKVAKQLKKRVEGKFEMEITEVEPSPPRAKTHHRKKMRFSRSDVYSSEEDEENLLSSDMGANGNDQRALASPSNKNPHLDFPMVDSPISHAEDISEQANQGPSTGRKRRKHRIRSSYHVPKENDDKDIDLGSSNES